MQYRSFDRRTDSAAVGGLVALAEAADGHPPLSEEKHRDLASPHGTGHGVVGEAEGHLVAYAHLLPTADGWQVELLVDPAGRSVDAYRSLAGAAMEALPDGSTARVWSFARDQADALRAMGMEECRELRQLRRPLPAPAPTFPDGVELAPFRPGIDDADWLSVHNAAFGADWNQDTLAGRLGRSWFDAEGFLLAWDGDRLAGYCWTKVHPAAVGEIYIIGIGPQHRGRGLGRPLVLAGLADLAGRRGCTTAMLYVDGDNDPAVRLYEGLGFVTARVDRFFAFAPGSAQPNR